MYKKNYKKILKKIENVRKKNNVNWMSILRIALENSPKETLSVICLVSKLYPLEFYDKNSDDRIYGG